MLKLLFKKIFFPTTISIVFSVSYYYYYYLWLEIECLKTLLYKTNDKMKLVNDKMKLIHDKYDFMFSRLTKNENGDDNGKDIFLVDSESQTQQDDVKMEEHEHEHDYEILETSPNIKVKARGNSVTDILTKFF
jgi:hypothetical protein